ncbi:hypothetical protein SeMB42_g04429 [Synchytrium endobioticum]|uniref:Ribosomal small subunit Rsm22 n=1 Tax=Synchytrium endobioticum TaxID=286115 RepID=A0A507CYI6_9FUNG|nr:hypothetical protein SeMB42_g04429 [Synchytrium endobioticum]
MDILRPNILRNAHLALSLYRPSTRTTAAALCISASQPWQPDASAPSAKVPVVLPRHLDDAVNSYLRGIKTKDLRALVDHFESLVYASLPRTANIRHLDPNRLTIPYDTPTYVKAYLAKRFVGSYSAITHVLQQLATRLPDYHPKHVLDVGAGPGTALWASSQFWTADAYAAVEPSRHMAHALQEISNAAYGTRIITIEPRLNTKIQADLVICAFVLTDIATQSSRAELIDSLWSSSTDILVLIESATPSGFKLIEDARAQILKKCTHGSIHVVAPCPHEFACPMSRTKSWCHFPRRYLPTAKNASSQSEIARYVDVHQVLVLHSPQITTAATNTTIPDIECLADETERTRHTRLFVPRLDSLNGLSSLRKKAIIRLLGRSSGVMCGVRKLSRRGL